MKLLRNFLIWLSNLLLLGLLNGSVLAPTATITNLNYQSIVTYGNSMLSEMRKLAGSQARLSYVNLC